MFYAFYYEFFFAAVMTRCVKIAKRATDDHEDYIWMAKKKHNNEPIRATSQLWS